MSTKPLQGRASYETSGEAEACTVIMITASGGAAGAASVIAGKPRRTASKLVEYCVGVRLTAQYLDRQVPGSALLH